MRNVIPSPTPSQALYNKIYENLTKVRELGKKSAFLFDRVSTAEQALTGLSLQYQSNFGKAYADAKNLFIIYSFEVAESGRNNQRKYFNLMLDLAIDFDVKHLIFKSVDRMSRNYKDLSAILDLIEQQDFNIHFYQQNKVINKNSTHDEKFMIGIEQAVAKHLSDKISHDVKQTNLYKAQQGINPAGNIRFFGYQYDSKQKQWIINQNERENVNLIFNEIKNNKSLATVCNLLNAKGIKTAKGGKWYKSTLHRMVTNPFYMGQFKYQGKIWPGNHEPYLTEGQFINIQRILGIRNIGKPGRNFLFKGLLYYSGRLLTGGYKTGAHHSGEYIYYSNAQLHANFKEQDIFNAVNNEMAKAQLPQGFDALLVEAFNRISETRRENSGQEKKQIIYRIGELEKENNRLLQALIDGYDAQTVKTRMNENRRIIESLEIEKNKLSYTYENHIIDLKLFIEDLKQRFEKYFKADKNEKIKILRSIANNILIRSEDKRHIDLIIISFKLPYSLFLEIKDELVNAERATAMSIASDRPSGFLKKLSCRPRGT